jgi:SpoVK/Ycf46/Vps4 family AAA+-type ATPase
MLEVGKLAATRQTWKRNTVRELVAEIMSEKPGGDERQWRKAFRDAVEQDEEYLIAVCDYAFDAAMHARERQSVRPPTSAEQKAVAAQQRATAAVDHAKLVSAIKEQIILLNQEMPNGQRVRFCTLDYMWRLGGAYRRVGKQGSRKLVGQTYSEETYRAKLGAVV